MTDWVAIFIWGDNIYALPVLAGSVEQAEQRLLEFGVGGWDFIVHYVEWQFGWEADRWTN